MITTGSPLRIPTIPHINISLGLTTRDSHFKSVLRVVSVLCFGCDVGSSGPGSVDRRGCEDCEIRFDQGR